MSKQTRAQMKQINEKRGGQGRWIPKEMLENEKERLAKIEKQELIEPPMIKVNMSSYTGYEPKSPKNSSIMISLQKVRA